MRRFGVSVAFVAGCSSASGIAPASDLGSAPAPPPANGSPSDDHADAGATTCAATTCKPPLVGPTTYRLPWHGDLSMQLSQDCNDSCCGEHTGASGYAWDFDSGSSFTVVAARGGTITHLKTSSTSGCPSTSCLDDANYLVVDHGDGTHAMYLHLEGGSLAPGVTCGAVVVQGQPLAISGDTGMATGIHLHFQVSKVIPNVTWCECGAAGDGCAPSHVAWSSFWATPSYPTLSIAFEEWPDASSCADRRITLPRSYN